jgi:hypothetical protein
MEGKSERSAEALPRLEECIQVVEMSVIHWPKIFFHWTSQNAFVEAHGWRLLDDVVKQRQTRNLSGDTGHLEQTIGWRHRPKAIINQSIAVIELE